MKKFIAWNLTIIDVYFIEMYERISFQIGDATVVQSEKREKFIRLAEGRTQLALDAIRKIGNLSNSRAYEYTDTDVKVIVKALRDATSEIERKFSSSSGETFNKFKLVDSS